jgi:hypothetical protein
MDAAGGDRITQFGRALSELNIDIICANSRQVKGRVERAFGTLQDRLMKELRPAGISTVAAPLTTIASGARSRHGRGASTKGNRHGLSIAPKRPRLA